MNTILKGTQKVPFFYVFIDMAITMTEGFILTITEVNGLLLTEDNVIIISQDDEQLQPNE